METDTNRKQSFYIDDRTLHMFNVLFLKPLGLLCYIIQFTIIFWLVLKITLNYVMWKKWRKQSSFVISVLRENKNQPTFTDPSSLFFYKLTIICHPLTFCFDFVFPGLHLLFAFTLHLEVAISRPFTWYSGPSRQIYLVPLKYLQTHIHYFPSWVFKFANSWLCPFSPSRTGPNNAVSRSKFSP